MKTMRWKWFNKIRMQGQDRPTSAQKLNRVISFILLFTIGMGQWAMANENQRVTLRFKNADLKTVIEVLQNQTGMDVIYPMVLLKEAHPISVTVKNQSIERALKLCFKDQPFTYVIEQDVIVLRRKDVRQSLQILPEKAPPTKALPMWVPDPIRGQVVDEEGNALIGVNVQVKGSSVGTSTDFDGRFELDNVEVGTVLQFTYIGFTTQEWEVKNVSDEISIVLLSDSELIDEVVVVGYGYKKSKDIISGISSVSTEKFGLEDQATPTAGELLKGRVSGVNIRENTGAAGATPVIQIRGISSINAGVGPLIVIDGFPVGNSFPQTLNSDDISTMTVLKDAEATAIYGARGSNGVVLIETKSARAGISEFNYNAFVGIQQVPQSWRPHMLDALEYAQYNIERVQALDEFNNATTPTPIEQVFLDVVNNPEQWRDGGTDWFDEYIREGSESLSQNHNLTYRMGNEKFRSVVSAGYLDQEGLLPGDDFQRMSIRGKIDANIHPSIVMGVNLSAAKTINNNVPSDGLRSTLWGAIATSPLQSPYDDNGQLRPFIPADAPGYFSKPNPIFESLERTNQTVNTDLQLNLNFDASLGKNWHYMPRFYVRQLSQNIENFKPTTIGVISLTGVGALDRGAPPQVNSGSRTNMQLVNWGLDNLLKYDRTLGGKHHVGLTIGHTIQREEVTSLTLNGSVFPSDEIINFSEAGEINASNAFNDWSLMAGFARASYDFDGKYLVEANMRREGSSRLGKSNRFGNFPSAAIGWRISNEAFFPDNTVINEVLLRSSFGKTGNNAIGNYESLGRLSPIRNVVGDQVVEGKFLSSFSNENLRWETSTQFQVGMNIGLFQDFLTFKVDYYRKYTKDMLFNVTLPRASGFASTRINLGEMENNGVDLEVGSFKQWGDWVWTSNFNISYLKNKVTKMPDQIDKILVGGRGGTNITTVGEEVGALHGFKRLGLFNEQNINDPNLHGLFGDAKVLGTNIFQDTNGDGYVDRTDMVVIGSPHPDVILGWSNQVNYKNFSFSILATGMFGYEIMPTVRDVDFNQVARYNVNALVLDRWKSVDDVGNGLVPRSEVNPGSREWMDAWLEPGDHIWIKNIKLSYTFPQDKIQAIGWKQLRFYLSINNVARFDNYSGFNPEVGGSNNSLNPGIDDYVYPLSRLYTFGVNFTF